ncbi:hypothetical protein L1987_21349 [Smallanthus sonchifolius]|uniref:Uncharacterized protein n=1 Tax=Smallanthus sonchifolius TaxID=185202 RepID=A0ACB9IVT2_9ASTR|nr:hypothetical protein L1987_21349 [Smallanthus sonchifolius]
MAGNNDKGKVMYVGTSSSSFQRPSAHGDWAPFAGYRTTIHSGHLQQAARRRGQSTEEFQSWRHAEEVELRRQLAKARAEERSAQEETREVMEAQDRDKAARQQGLSGRLGSAWDNFRRS